MTKNITCINCPMGCYLTVEVDGAKVTSVSGNLCKRGEDYAKAECVAPTRMFSTTIRLHGASVAQLPVKSSVAVPKDMVRGCVKALKDVEVHTPICMGQVIVADILGTGANIIATREV